MARLKLKYELLCNFAVSRDQVVQNYRTLSYGRIICLIHLIRVSDINLVSIGNKRFLTINSNIRLGRRDNTFT